MNAYNIEMDVDSQIILDRFTPKSYQYCLFDAVENKGYKRVMLIWPRRAGKDIAAFNLCIREALRKRMVVWYIFPTYSQGKKALWDSITTDGFRFLDYIPPDLIFSKNSQEMKITLMNGSIIQIIGSDNYDSLVGANPQLCIFSEYALQDPKAFQYVSPILRANKGTAIFLSTVRGKNHLYTLYNVALNNPEWFVQKLTVDDTQHVSVEEIQREIDSGEISNDLAQQEYWNSWTMGIDGSIYGHLMNKLRLNNQIGNVPCENGFPVYTAWDIGYNDDTVIIFFQVVGQTIRIIDMYVNRLQGMDHYAQVLNNKGYAYGKHFGPHDLNVHEKGKGIMVKQTAAEFGINFVVTPIARVQDGIEMVRTVLPRCWINEPNCGDLIKALENYRREYDSKNGVYSNNPVRDWTSHICDTMRYLAQNIKNTNKETSPEELERRYLEALYGDKLNQLPPYHPLRSTMGQ